MSVFTTLITGMMVGFELYEDELGKGFVIDLFIVRLVFMKDHA